MLHNEEKKNCSVLEVKKSEHKSVSMAIVYNYLQFSGVYPHAKFQVILLVNFKDMSNFKTFRNTVGLRGRHHYLTCILQKDK